MKTKKLKVQPSVGPEPQQWELRHDRKGVWYTIEVEAFVEISPETQTSPPLVGKVVRLRQVFELSNPDNDVALLVGKLKIYHKSGRLSPNRPELWFYDNQFWTKANDMSGQSYYSKKKLYVLQPIEILDPDGLFAEIHIPGGDE